MPHDNNCISRHCMGCGPESEIGKVKDKYAKERQRNNTLLRELKKVKEELVVAQERITELETKAPIVIVPSD